MGKNLEDELFEYNYSDVFIPGKMLRHVPRVLKYRSTVCKIYDLFVISAVTTAQIIAYTSLVQLLSNG
jgi:hypothetical protein